MTRDDPETGHATTIPSGVPGEAGAAESVPISVGFIPSLPAPSPFASPPSSADLLSLCPGQQIEDFHVIATLGRGGFGAVYLAWQLSLGRQVALKISPSIGQEGRSLARLDHPHIVRVYSESLHQGMRLLCMQYVPSAALDDLLSRLVQRSVSWAGRDLLETIDGSHPVAAEFDPEQLSDRQKLSELDHADAACWIVSRLADALAHAHRHDVVHRDLKPGNVLISQYGRPMLVDFNLANILEGPPLNSHVFGGTLPYMAPEHLDAFNPENETRPEAVGRKADLYSLGVILFELLLGRLPFPSPSRDKQEGAENGGPARLAGPALRQMAEIRRHAEGLWTAPELLAEPAIRAVLQRSLAADPAGRWESADEMSRTLSEVSELRRTLAEVERRSPFRPWFRRRPFLTLALVGLVPQLLGSLVNIPYNLLRIVSRDEPVQREAFFQLVNWYNVLVYPGCIWLCFALVRPVFRHWIRREERFDDSTSIADIRHRVIQFPIWNARVALLGWLPGMVWFPLGLSLLAGPLTWQQVCHLQLSILLSGLIALTYSSLGVVSLVLSVFYPALWIDPRDFRQQSDEEVRSLRILLRAIPVMAGTIPLIGALLLIGASPLSFHEDIEYLTFRILTISLIAFGMIGYQIAVIATTRAARAISAFRGRPSVDD